MILVDLFIADPEILQAAPDLFGFGAADDFACAAVGHNDLDPFIGGEIGNNLRDAVGAQFFQKPDRLDADLDHF